MSSIKQNLDTLLNVFLQSNSTDPLLAAFGALLHCPLLVTDNAYHIVAAYSPAGFEQPEYRRALAHSELPMDLCRAIAARDRATNDLCVPAFGASGCRVSELRRGEVLLGFLLYIMPAEHLPEPTELNFAERLIAKQFDADKHTGGLVTDTAEEILTDLLDGAFADEQIFRDRTTGTFLAQFSPTHFALLSPPMHMSGISGEEHLRETVSRELAASYPFFYNGCLVLFLHRDHDPEDLRRLTERYRLGAVLSSELPNLYAIGKLISPMRETLQYLCRTTPAPFFAWAEDYMLPMWLVRLQNEGTLPTQSIRRLADYDARNNTALCLTFYTYLTCAHSLKRTCEKLYTHRNTVQYRIRKIRDDFGIDPDDTEHLTGTLLSLALALWQDGQTSLFLPDSEHPLPRD